MNTDKHGFRTAALALALFLGPWDLGLGHSATASWYGDEHRGRLMANGQRFDPDRLIAASWDYPLGTMLTVSRADGIPMSVIVTITDRGPHRRFVRRGRVIDLSRAAFARLEGLEMGLVAVKILPDGIHAGRSGLDGERRRDEQVHRGGGTSHTSNPANHSIRNADGRPGGPALP